MSKQLRAATPQSWRRRSRISLRPAPNSRRLTRALAAIILLVCTLHAIDEFYTSRRELYSKYQPTLFNHLSFDEQVRLADPGWQSTDRAPREDHAGKSAYSRHALWTGQSQWTRLGRGFEGETFQHQNVAVKVYREKHTPFRNCISGHDLEQRWPTEIPASLILGGTIIHGQTIGENATFLPVIDYFLASSSPEQDRHRRWHFVTDFQANGNLEKLGRRLHSSDRAYTARDLDFIFRSSLNRLLRGLDDMHTNHDLCHDDVKLDNVFVGADENATDISSPNEATHWILADLGNVREPGHPYHKTRIWTKGNLSDCRANDVMRLLKTYLGFLRISVADMEVFETELFEAVEPWSRLFWSVWDESLQQNHTTARVALERSLNEFAPADEPSLGMERQPFGLHNPLARLFVGRRWALSMATQHVLKTTTSETSARFWGMVSVFGVPHPACPGWSS